MSEVEKLAQEQFNTFKTRLCEILSEIEEEHKSAFMQGYAKGETDEKFRTKQVVIKDSKELQEEIAELDCQKNRNKSCYSCANATERCFRNEIGCPCQNYKSYKDENAELKEKCETLEDMIDEGISYQKAKDYDGVVTSLLEQNHLVTKAREIIKKFSEFANNEVEYDHEHPEEHTDLWNELCEEAEQFLKEVSE